MFIFNCEDDVGNPNLTSVHPTNSYTDYRVGVETPGKYRVILNSDEKRFGGHNRIDSSGEYFTTPMEWNGRKNWVQVYSPARTVLVLGL